MVERCSCRLISLILRKQLCNLDNLSHLHATQHEERVRCFESMTIWKRQEFVKMLSESRVLGHLRFGYGLLHALTVLTPVDTLSRLYFPLQ
jgi:hypothetical protein